MSANVPVPVARRVLDVFATAGVRTAFGLPGVHNLAFWREAVDSGLRIVGTRHEQSTVYAADGMARASGGLGVALTTTGPGAANAAGAFGEAAASGSPVVLVASEVSTKLARKGLLRGVLHESRDQAAIFEPLAKAVLRPRTAAACTEAAARAVEVALSWPRGPVYMDIPTDLLDQPAPAAASTPPTRLVPESDQVEAAAHLIGQAERIVLWVGGGVVQAGAESALQRLAEKLQAPIVTTYGSRGFCPSAHPLMLGLPPHEPEVERLISESDLMVAVGSDFDGMMTRNWSMPRSDKLVTINCSATDSSANYAADAVIVADARLALEQLEAAVSHTQIAASRVDVGTSVEELRRAAWDRLRRDPVSAPACRFLDAVNGAVSRHDATVVVDMAIPGYWIGGYAQMDRTRQLQYPVGWGTLGYALPAAIGPAVSGDRPTLSVSGDGGFMFALGELATIRQENLDITMLVVDDGGYGMLRYDQDHAGDEHRGVDLHRPDFVALASAFGIPAIKADPNDLEEHLDASLASPGPMLVVLEQELIPPRTTSPRWHE